MVTADVKLDESSATIAALPAVFICGVEHELQCSISGTVSPMGFSFTHRARDFCASRASCPLILNVLNADESKAENIRAVCTIRSLVLDPLRFILSN